MRKRRWVHHVTSREEEDERKKDRFLSIGCWRGGTAYKSKVQVQIPQSSVPHSTDRHAEAAQTFEQVRPLIVKLALFIVERTNKYKSMFC